MAESARPRERAREPEPSRLANSRPTPGEPEVEADLILSLQATVGNWTVQRLIREGRVTAGLPPGLGNRAVQRLLTRADPQARDELLAAEEEALLSSSLPTGAEHPTPSERQPATAAGEPTTIQRQTTGSPQAAAEERLKTFLADLKLEKKEEKDQGTEALKQTLAAFFETDTGKKLKNALLTKKNVPFIVMIGSAALAGMIANNTSIPSTPDLPLFGDVTAKIEFQGTFQNPTGIKFTFSVPLGGREADRPKAGGPAVPELPAKAWGRIKGIDDETLRKWLANTPDVRAAFTKWETAGPDEEEAAKRQYQAVRGTDDFPPDTQPVAEALARQLVAGGQTGATSADLDLGQEDEWSALRARLSTGLAGLGERLKWLADLLVAVLPEAAGVTRVVFHVGGLLLPVLVTSTPEQEEGEEE